jgi:RsiW-degrading membrane proteinase PrsW (M82 family)
MKGFSRARFGFHPEGAAESRHFEGRKNSSSSRVFARFQRIPDGFKRALNRTVGTNTLEGFSLKEMFSQTFRRRTAAEVEDYLIVGTSRTTPELTEVQSGWPKPWLFARFLVFFGLIYLGFTLGYLKYHNEALIPGLILIGTFAVPLTTLTLFFELNSPRNVSVYRLAILVSLGGLVSLLLSLVGYDISGLSWLGSCSAGIIEELAKLAALILIVRGRRYPFILNGMVLGAAVGAGFGAFESAGVALHTLARSGAPPMISNIMLRGLFAPLMHVAWTAMVGAALWRAKEDGAVTLRTLGEAQFCKVFLLAVLLHMLWNVPCPEPPFRPKELLLGVSAWFVIWRLVQQGLNQVREHQRLLNPNTSGSAHNRTSVHLR